MAKGKRVPNAGPNYIEDTTTPLNNGAVKEIIIPGEDAYGEGGNGSPIREGVVADIQFPGEDAYGSTEEATSPTTVPDAGEIPSPEVAPLNMGAVDVNSPLNQGLKNADLNYNQYGDDSSAANQATAGGMREKNTGEGVATSNVEYNPNASMDNLDYKYGKDAQYANSDSAGYLARRNDEIASALFNAGLVEKADIIQYLANQPGWNNSTEADRVNTVESIWKRLGELSQEQQQEETQQAEFDESRMQEGIQESSEGLLYGKNTPDEGNPEQGIAALVDKNSFYESMKQSRIALVKEAYSINSEKVAYLMSEGRNPFSEMTMRDLQEFYPEKYNEIQEEYKKIIGQSNVDSISMGEGLDITSHLAANENNVTTSMNYFVNNTADGSAAGQLSTNLNNALAESEIASTAREQREIYKRKIIEIKQAAESLETEANNIFKGDVPDYMVKAFINNRMQKYNKEIEKYQQLFNASLDEEKREVSQQQWNTEMAYKWGSLNADINYKNANLELSRQELAYKMKKDEMSNGQWNDDGTYSYIDMNGVMHTVPRAEAEKVLNTDLYNKATSYIEYWQNAINNANSAGLVLYGDQCEVMTDNYTNQYWGVTMTKEDGTATTLVEDKAKYVTDSIPEKGFVAIWNYGIKQADGNNYGHTGIVIDYDPITGKFTTLESNRKKTKDGTPIITIQEMDINDSHLLGFWNPTKGTPRNRKGTSDVAWDYYDYPNGMMDVFIAAESYAKDKLGVEGTKDVLRAERAYGMLNRMNIEKEIDAIMNSEEIAEAYNTVTNFLQSEWFIQNAYIRGMTDNEGNFFLDTVLQYLVNSGDYGITPTKKQALDDLIGLIQIKLRKESGAAINVSEWISDYNRYLPQIGMSPQQKLKRIQILESDVSSSMLPGEYKKKYIPIITDEMVAKASTEVTTKDQAEEAFKKIK